RQRGLAVVRADAQALPFADGSFDAILAPRGLFRYLDYERAFQECARVLAPGGRLAVHQYAARTWSLRDLARTSIRGPTGAPASGPARASEGPARPAPARHDGDTLHVHHLEELCAPARRAG